jgi:DNA-directed RNA polymerase subunit alpha
MSTLNCIENYIDKDQNYYGSFIIEPLEIGQGITLGNALRRTLLSDLTGFAITGVRINDLKHEFAILENSREDVLEILLNLKEVIFAALPLKNEKNEKLNYKAFLNIEGPAIVTAGMFKFPKNTIKVINPNQYICTIINKSKLYLEIDVENGKGYQLSEENKKKNNLEKFLPVEPSTLIVDAIFMPIKRVNYKVKLIHDSKGNIKESLNLEILTNGSLTPKRSLYEAVKILLDLIYPLLIFKQNKNELFLENIQNLFIE